MDDIAKLLKENAVLPLWPETARVLKVSRPTVYALAKRGEIEIVDLGRLRRATTAGLRRKLGIRD